MSFSRNTAQYRTAMGGGRKSRATFYLALLALSCTPKLYRPGFMNVYHATKLWVGRPEIGVLFPEMAEYSFSTTFRPAEVGKSEY
jgi:hypothetical protein